jgi:hypothetical protein
VLKPAGDAFEVFVPLGQDAGVDEDLADVALVASRRQFVEQFVAEGLPFGREAGQELGARALFDPLDRRER